ncbi:MAG: hypothetical protein IK015_05305 [Treponema sp.]|nr:hypothetical protein [Treponema sp.]
MKKKKLENLTFADDGMFQAVLRNPAICAELVELLLGVKIKRVEYPELEKAIKPFYTTKGVRLDVYLKDSLMKGEKYKKLKDSYILFICKYDPFKDRNRKPFCLPRYTFKNACEENNLVKLHDKSVKVVYNAKAYKKEKDKRIRALLRFVQTNKPGTDDFASRLSEIVKKLKESEKFKEEYARMNLHDRDLIRETKREAYAEKAVEDAVMIVRKYNATPEAAAQDAGAPLDKVLEALAAQPAPAQA